MTSSSTGFTVVEVSEMIHEEQTNGVKCWLGEKCRDLNLIWRRKEREKRSDQEVSRKSKGPNPFIRASDIDNKYLH